MSSILNNSFIDMSFDESSKIITSIWKTAPSSEELRSSMTTKKEFAKKNKVGKLFFDPTNLGAISPDDQQWLFQEFIGSIISEVGSLKIANVVPNDVFTKMSLEEILTVAPGLEFQYFDDKQKAINWLMS